MTRECIGPGGPAGLQNRDGGASGVFGGFDSHTLPCLALIVGLLCSAATPVVAQADSVPANPYHAAPVSPMGAFFRSLLVPGWAQAKLDRRLPGGIFLAFEGIALGMTIKASRELAYLQDRGDPEESIQNKKQEREDWITLLAFNHLFAALDGFVGSHLYDFPDELTFRAAPSGFGAVVRIPVRLP